jgi:hypothetical protein
MKRLSYYGSILAVSLILGTSSAWWAMGRPSSFLRNGPWQYHPLLGNVNAGPYLRAQVARLVPAPVNASEAVYFMSGEDNDGNELRCDHNYRIEGRDLEARWWSITCYDEAGYLIPNRRNRYSYTMNNVAHNADGSYTIRLSRSEKPGNWLPTGEGKSFSLVLRLYNPASLLRENLSTAELPRIVWEE